MSNRYAARDDEMLNEAAGLSGGGEGATFMDVARVMALSAGFNYASTCLAMPFEVGKLLLQVQWVPRDEVWLSFGEMEREEELTKARRAGATNRRGVQQTINSEDDDDDDNDSILGATGTAADWATDGDDVSGGQRDFGGEDDELSDEDDADLYFHDQSNQSSGGRTTDLSSMPRRRKKPTDSTGYVMRRSVHEDSTRPEFIMPIVVRGGVWEMIKAVGRGKEGYFGLWKGTLTTFLTDTATSTVQPIVSLVLSTFAPSALTPMPLPYAPYPYRSLALLLSSHLLTGFIVSPLDLIRTRLIAQSTLSAHRKYSSPLHALRQILHEEGGWRSIYLHPNLLIPTILDYTIRPLFSLGTPLYIEHKLRLDPLTSPVRYSLAEFLISNLSLLITLPIETVRRRLQLQTRSTLRAARKAVRSKAGEHPGGVSGTVPLPVYSKPLRTCVETRPRPYEGVCEAIYRIVTEETSITPVKKNLKAKAGMDAGRQKDSSMFESGILARPGSSSFGGLYSLYRGLGFSVGANALIFVLAVVTGERAHGTAGWTEI
jgi:fusion and transport protein UGO1